MPFFHNCQIRRKIRIKNIIKSNLSCGRHHFPYCRLLCRKPKALAPCGTNCRSDLGDHDLIRIHNGIHDLNRIISFTKCTGRAMCDALSTKGAIHIFDILHIYRATSTVVLAPVLTTSQTLACWILSQTCTQRIHLIHFAESRMIGKE